jgi:hypothetical protein
MRKVIENQLKIGQTDIPNIQIDINCRDEVPQLLLGLQFLYSNKQIQDEVFLILKKITPKEVDADKGRPGMDLWKILVLGTLRLNCNWDYDKVHDIANEHNKVREFLGHTIHESKERYGLQTIKDNVSLLTPELLDEINQVVVKAGHELVRKKDEKTVLKGRCDSFVLETDVHYPTDINLLLDAILHRWRPSAVPWSGSRLADRRVGLLPCSCLILLQEIRPPAFSPWYSRF